MGRVRFQDFTDHDSIWRGATTTGLTAKKHKNAKGVTTTIFTTKTLRHKDTTMERRLATEGTEITEVAEITDKRRDDERRGEPQRGERTQRYDGAP